MIQPHILRQVLILSGVTMSSVSDGFIFGQMSGMLATLADPASEIPLTDNQISWIAATINATCICGFALASVITDKIGRKRTVTVLTMPIISVWILVYFANTYTIFIVSRILVGLFFGGVVCLTIVVTGEYTAPNVRGFWLNIVNSGGTSIGTMIGHILGFFFHWRTVALLGIIPTGISAILPFFWVESPSWLAQMGRYKECEAAFKSLHEHRPDAEAELQLLLQLEKDKNRNSTKTFFSDLGKVLTAMKQRYFWKIALLTVFINVYRVAGSKILFSTLAVTMLQEITGQSNILLFTLLVDGFLVLGAFLSCYFISVMKMRTLLLSTGIIANVFLFILSACLYFKLEKNINFSWINCTLLACYFICVNAGPYPVLENLFGEIFPLDIKGTSIFIFGTFAGGLHFLAIKYYPNMFTLMGYHGVFFMNGVIMLLCLLYFWLQLPETKGRTLQEIELFFKYNTFEKPDKIINVDQAKVLMQC